MPLRTPRSVCLLTSALAAAEAYWLFGLGVAPVAGGCALVSVLCLLFASSAWTKVTLCARECGCDAVHFGARFVAISRSRELSAPETAALFLGCNCFVIVKLPISTQSANRKHGSVIREWSR